MQMDNMSSPNRKTYSLTDVFVDKLKVHVKLTNRNDELGKLFLKILTGGPATVVKLGHHEFTVSRNRHPAFTNLKYICILEKSGFIIALHYEKSPPKESECKEYSATVLFTGLSLLSHGGFFSAWTKLSEYLSAVEIKQDKTLVSHVDLTADIVGLPVRQFTDKYKTDCFITNSRKVGNFISSEQAGRNKPLGLVFGGKSLRCTIYDKIEKLKDQAPEMSEMLHEKWLTIHGKRPQDVTRLEFSVTRQNLKEFSVNTVFELHMKIPGIWSYLTQQRIRFTVSPFKRSSGNQKRVALWHVWQDIQGLSTAASEPRNIKKYFPNPENARKRAMRLLMESYWSSHDSIDRFDWEEYCKEAIQMLSEMDFINLKDAAHKDAIRKYGATG